MASSVYANLQLFTEDQVNSEEKHGNRIFAIFTKSAFQ